MLSLQGQPGVDHRRNKCPFSFSQARPSQLNRRWTRSCQCFHACWCSPAVHSSSASVLYFPPPPFWRMKVMTMWDSKYNRAACRFCDCTVGRVKSEAQNACLRHCFRWESVQCPQTRLETYKSPKANTLREMFAVVAWNPVSVTGNVPAGNCVQQQISITVN